MLICSECGEIFEMARVISERHGLDTPPYERLNICPFCESTDIHQAHRCEVCGEWITDDYIILSTSERICEECYTRHVIDED